MAEWSGELSWYRLREERERNAADEGAVPLSELQVTVGTLHRGAVLKPAVTSKCVGQTWETLMLIIISVAPYIE